MTEKQKDFLVALRLSGISLTEDEAVLAFELAKFILNSDNPDFRGWAKVQAENYKEPKPTPPPVRKERTYSEFYFEPSMLEYTMAC